MFIPFNCTCLSKNQDIFRIHILVIVFFGILEITIIIDGYCHFQCVKCNPTRSSIIRSYDDIMLPKISLQWVLHKVQVVKLVNICARSRKSRFS